MVFLPFLIFAQGAWRYRFTPSPHPAYPVVSFSTANKAYLMSTVSMFGPRIKKFWEFDGSQWTQKSNFPDSLITDVVGFAVNGKGYIITSTKVVWEFNIATNTWSRKSDFPGSARTNAVAFSIGSKGFIGTGVTSSGIYLRDFWEYKQQNDTWIKRDSFPGMARKGAIAFSINGKGYIGGGAWQEVNYSPTYYTDMWQFDTTTNNWTVKASLTEEIMGAVSFVSYNQGFIARGTNLYGASNSAFKYDPVQNKWYKLTDLNDPSLFAAPEWTKAFSAGPKGYVLYFAGDLLNYDSTYNIQTGNVSPSTLCAGDTIIVPFTMSQPGMNIFRVQLSDNNGKFKGMSGIISENNYAQVNASSLTAIIPQNLALASAMYRIRIIAIDMYYGFCYGKDNGTDLTIHAAPKAIVIPDTNSICIATRTNVNFTASLSTPNTILSYRWKRNGIIVDTASNKFSANNFKAGDSVICLIQYINNCGAVRTASKTIAFYTGYDNPKNPDVVYVENCTKINSVFQSGHCAGSSLQINFSTSGTFDTTNLFVAQLSDKSGSFDTPAVMGYLKSASPGTMTAMVPVKTNTGSFRIRVMSTYPVSAGHITWDSLQVTKAPEVNAGADTVLCLGDPITLQAITDAHVFNWSDGIVNGSTLRPGITKKYTLSGTDTITGCVAGDTISVIVKAVPWVSAGPDVRLCSGESITLFAVGGISNYTWNNNVVHGVPFRPLQTADYIVTVTGTNGCPASDTVTVKVMPLPSVNAGQDKTICSGKTTALNASGNAGKFTWSNNVQNGIPFVPDIPRNYILTGMDTVSACKNYDTVRIDIVPSFTKTYIGGNILPGKGQTAQYAVLPVSGVSYQWSVNGGIIQSGQNTSTVHIQWASAPSTGYVSIIESNGNCFEFDTLKVDILNTGIADTERTLRFTIYPNPVNDMLRVQIMPQPGAEIKIRVFSIEGRLLLEKASAIAAGSGELTVGVAGLTQGIYLLVVSSVDRVGNGRFYKN